MKRPGETPAGNVGEVGSCTSCEMKARNVSPLLAPLLLVPLEEPLLLLLLLLPLLVVLLGLLFELQERAKLHKTEATNVSASRFNPGTPKSMRDRDLDARIGIITEQLLNFSHGTRLAVRGDAKPTPILYSRSNAIRSVSTP
jgi:hypothetical protein